MTGVRQDTCRGGSYVFWRGPLVGAWLLMAGLWAFLPGAWGAPPPQDLEETESLADEPLADVLVEGLVTIDPTEVRRKIKTRAGRALDRKTIREDVKALYDTRWFFSVETKYRRTEKGLVLVIRLRERPVLQSVDYEGTKKIRKKDLAALTNLQVGSAFDVALNQQAARRIESYYHEKGFVFAEVSLKKGADKDDRDVVFVIKEGPKVKVSSVTFQGNTFVSDALLKLKIRSKERLLWLVGGGFDPANINDDVQMLKDYYQGLGFFDVKIEPQQKFNSDKSLVELDFAIDEGVRYKVRSVVYEGNRVISEAALRADLKVQPNEYFNERALRADLTKVTDQYSALGRLFAKVDAVPTFPEEPGIVDIVYKIDEDQVYRVGRIQVNILDPLGHPRTREAVVINKLLLKPGDLADMKQIRKSESRLRGTEVFASANSAGGADAPRISVRPRIGPELQQTGSRIVRAQGLAEPSFGQPPPLLGSDSVGAQAFQDPLVDLDVNVTETQTGRLMLGVAYNSDVGPVGSIVLEEKNFDITRFPRSPQDFLDNKAFRGNGEQFRIEALPGNQISRYLASWRSPNFLDQDVSLGVSGFFYQRLYPDWDEDRLGGRISLGRQLTNNLSVNAALRLENVNLETDRNPRPQLLTDALGDSFLSTIRFGVAHDTRDVPFLPGKGHYIEAGVEQAFGEFNYTRGDITAQQYFTAYERPDGTGRHIVSVTGSANYTGTDTPIYERFFAGGYQSFRGFSFRGVSPIDTGVRTGGRFQALGTVEYLLPITVDDHFHLVAFSDFGTVENDFGFDDFRATVGGGLRITVDALGPVPIALDWAVPLTKQEFDTTRLFAFYVGFAR